MVAIAEGLAEVECALGAESEWCSPSALPPPAELYISDARWAWGERAGHHDLQVAVAQSPSAPDRQMQDRRRRHGVGRRRVENFTHGDPPTLLAL